MKTFILLWNPEISDYPYKSYCRQYLRNVGSVITWNLFDYQDAQPGDRVFWLRCGEGRTGILMVGTIYESPFEDVHWRYPEQRTSYVPFLVEYAVDPEEMPLITTEMLSKEMPEFEWNGGKEAKVYISGLGYYLLFLNGKRVGDHVLDPVVTRYDMRARYVEYDVTEFLNPGRNTIAVVLGNGWYNCQTKEVWHFDKAPWQDDPKLLFELESDGKTLVKSDSSWKVFRNGAFR